MAGPHHPERAATTDLPNQINYVCMYMWSDSSGGRASDCRSMGRWIEPHLW